MPPFIIDSKVCNFINDNDRLGINLYVTIYMYIFRSLAKLRYYSFYCFSSSFIIPYSHATPHLHQHYFLLRNIYLHYDCIINSTSRFMIIMHNLFTATTQLQPIIFLFAMSFDNSTDKQIYKSCHHKWSYEYAFFFSSAQQELLYHHRVHKYT